MADHVHDRPASQDFSSRWRYVAAEIPTLADRQGRLAEAEAVCAGWKLLPAKAGAVTPDALPGRDDHAGAGCCPAAVARQVERIAVRLPIAAAVDRTGC